MCLLLAGCGGGGGGGGAPSAPPAPQATIALSTEKAKVGDTVTLTWSATNATSCVGSEGISGPLAVSGSTTVLSVAGRTRYTISCSGGGRSATQTATLIVPLPVQKSSYDNKELAAAIGAQTYPDGAGDATAFADFFGDGSFSMVTHTLEYDPANTGTKNKFGHIKFYQKVNGSWVENTARLLTDSVGCLHPRKAVIADFNGDGKPDVFFACHGFDAAPFPGEKQVYLLSQADGSYRKALTAYDCFCHGASAAEMTNRGYADIVVADQTVEGKPYFLINNRDGTFTKDTSRFPDSLKNKQIWTAELVDLRGTGKYDVFLAGADPQGDGYQINPTIFTNDGSNSFVNALATEIPLTASAVGSPLGMTLDVEFDGANVYLLRTFSHGAQVNDAISVQKTVLGGSAGVELYSHSGAYPNTSRTWFPWFVRRNGSLTTLDNKISFAIGL